MNVSGGRWTWGGPSDAPVCGMCASACVRKGRQLRCPCCSCDDVMSRGALPLSPVQTPPAGPSDRTAEAPHPSSVTESEIPAVNAAKSVHCPLSSPLDVAPFPPNGAERGEDTTECEREAICRRSLARCPLWYPVIRRPRGGRPADRDSNQPGISAAGDRRAREDRHHLHVTRHGRQEVHHRPVRHQAR